MAADDEQPVRHQSRPEPREHLELERRREVGEGHGGGGAQEEDDEEGTRRRDELGRGVEGAQQRAAATSPTTEITAAIPSAR